MYGNFKTTTNNIAKETVEMKRAKQLKLAQEVAEFCEKRRAGRLKMLNTPNLLSCKYLSKPEQKIEKIVKEIKHENLEKKIEKLEEDLRVYNIKKETV